MPPWPHWLGDLPTWITTLAVAVAVGQFMIDRERRAREAEREVRAQATQLTSWTVTDAGSDPRAFGVVLSNTSGSTFHDVVVRVRIHAEEQPTIKLLILPPGTYFVRLNRPGEKFPWVFAVERAEHPGHLRPYMRSEEYQVIALDFSDNLGQRWTTDHRARLRPL